MTGLPTVSIIVEWSNALLTEADRPARMMQALHDQAEKLASAQGSDPEPGLFPLEVLVCFDGSQVDGQAISQMAPLAAPGRHGAIDVRHCDFAGAEYYDLKNLGSKQAGGQLFLFLDSDVVPENDWLENLWNSFFDPAHAVVAGLSYIDPVNLYAKATALNWVFDVSPDWRDIKPSKHFWANNVCFRREVLRELVEPYRKSPLREDISLTFDILQRNLEKLKAQTWVFDRP